MCTKWLSHVRLFTITWIIACQTPLSTVLPKQEFWSGLPFPHPGDLPNSGTEPASLSALMLAGRLFITEPLGKLPNPECWVQTVNVSKIKNKHISQLLWQRKPCKTHGHIHM